MSLSKSSQVTIESFILSGHQSMASFLGVFNGILSSYRNFCIIPHEVLFFVLFKTYSTDQLIHCLIHVCALCSDLKVCNETRCQERETGRIPGLGLNKDG